MADTSLNWEYNISCNGIISSAEDVHTGLSSAQAMCVGLVSGDRYNVTVIAYFTNDVNEVYSGVKTEEQAIGKIFNSSYASPNFCCMLMIKLQTVWTQIRTDQMSVLFWIQVV